jgi:parvulin-like peptidyl-prolyl isomerase
MKTWILAGAIAFAAVGPVLTYRDTASAAVLENQITEVNIAQIKSLLKLRAQQEPLWARVERVLLSVAREQAQSESAGFVRRISRRVVSIAFNSAVAQRVKDAALPLLASLDEEQRETVRRLARRMGIGDMVAMLN